MNRRVSVSLLLVGMVAAGTALAARPVKQPTPSVPVVADATGAIVGPVVPTVDNGRLFAAVHRYNGNSVKVLFAGPATFSSYLDAASNRALNLVGPALVYFPYVSDCTGQGYVQDTDFASIDTANAVVTSRSVAKEFRGYASMAVYPMWPNTGATKPVIVSIDWTQPTFAPGVSGSVITPEGTCSFNVAIATTSAAGTLYPVTVVAGLSFTGPYTIE